MSLDVHVCIEAVHVSAPELELISVSLRPRYLSPEFGRIVVTVVCAAVFDSSFAARAVKQSAPPSVTFS